jgi:hypothetical protein
MVVAPKESSDTSIVGHVIPNVKDNLPASGVEHTQSFGEVKAHGTLDRNCQQCGLNTLLVEAPKKASCFSFLRISFLKLGNSIAISIFHY